MQTGAAAARTATPAATAARKTPMDRPDVIALMLSLRGELHARTGGYSAGPASFYFVPVRMACMLGWTLQW